MKGEQIEELPLIHEASAFVEYLKYLHKLRKTGKQRNKRGPALTKLQRIEILQKTNFKCHICGKPINPENFQADHVQSHISGGAHSIDNFLPSCYTCNNYRWHYSWQEIQYILKIGVWAKTIIKRNGKLGRILAEQFISYDAKRESRRKKPR